MSTSQSEMHSCGSRLAALVVCVSSFRDVKNKDKYMSHRSQFNILRSEEKRQEFAPEWEIRRGTGAGSGGEREKSRAFECHNRSFFYSSGLWAGARKRWHWRETFLLRDGKTLLVCYEEVDRLLLSSGVERYSVARKTREVVHTCVYVYPYIYI